VGKVRRARPKYLGPALASGVLSPGGPSAPDALYFNRGSSGLKFALAILGQMLGRRPIVCMQSFNCWTVLDAALEAGAEVLLSDVKLSDLSMPLDFVCRSDGKFDVLLLLHYQGQRNEEHAEIADWCADHSVVLIEDLAHCPDHEWPLLGDLGLASYAFDKPFCGMHGGALVRGRAGDGLWGRLSTGHEALPLESHGKEQWELRLLDFLMEYSTPGAYEGGDGPVLALQALQALHAPRPLLAFLLRHRIFSKALRVPEVLLARIRKRLGWPVFVVSRLGEAKIALIQTQRERYAGGSGEYEALARELALAIEARYGVVPQPVSRTTNRISALCPDDGVKLDMARLGIEAGNYNWPTPLHLGQRSDGVRFAGEFPNSEHASRHIVNIPAWSRVALERLRCGTVVDDGGRGA
jgi:dTDP-4-amino-4,6-dideoxygalactose transaminase